MRLGIGRPSNIQTRAIDGLVGGATEEREIILLGGSGDVGKRLARLLAENTRAAVTTVSRHSKSFSDQSGERFRHIPFDLSGRDRLDIPANILVVNLTEATRPALARHVIDSGGWFLETSASPGYLSAIMDALQGTAGPGTAILCVGMAPGLTNLMAAEVAAEARNTVQIDIGVEMGMGRHYGVAGTEWFLRTAGMPYTVVIDHAVRKVAPGQLMRKFAFREGGPRRLAKGYGFAEQRIIAEGTGQHLKTVRSFVALDPAWMTRGLSLLLYLGLGPAIGRNARKLAKWLLRTPVFGHMRSRLIVEGFDDADQLTGRIRLETGDQAEATAAMIFATVQGVFGHRGPNRAGLTMIDDHLCLDEAMVVLRQVLPETRVTVRLNRDIADRTGVGK